MILNKYLFNNSKLPIKFLYELNLYSLQSKLLVLVAVFKIKIKINF